MSGSLRAAEPELASLIDYRDYPILLVDDEPENLQAFVLNFRKEFTIETAPGGEEALEALRRRAFAVILTDQRMPGMSGVHLLHESIKVDPHLVRLIVTGFTDQESLIAAINQARIFHYVTKPWDLQDLRLTLRRAIEAWALAARNRQLLGDLRGRMVELQGMVEERTRALREANERLRRLAISDGLTGLYNHRYFQERWRREIARARRYEEPVSLMILDVDKFKNFNDTMGHPAGDSLLREISSLLVRAVREFDLVARYGGEEFVIVLPRAKKGDATVLAERVRSMIGHHPFPHRDVQPGGRVTVSIGVATFPEDGADAGEVIQRADQALYRAKKSGRDRVTAAGQGDGAAPVPEEAQDMDLVVEEDGEARPALQAAADVPLAASLDASVLRSFQERKQSEIDGTDSGKGRLGEAADRAVAGLSPPPPSRAGGSISSPTLPWVSSPGRGNPSISNLPPVAGTRRVQPPSDFDGVLGAGDDEDESGVVVEVARASSQRLRSVQAGLTMDSLMSTGDLLVGDDDGAVPPSGEDDMQVEVDVDDDVARYG